MGLKKAIRDLDGRAGRRGGAGIPGAGSLPGTEGLRGLGGGGGGGKRIPDRAPRTGAREWWRLAATGALLAGLAYLAFFYEPFTNEALLGTGRPLESVEVVTPKLDPAILESVSDETEEQRLRLEPRAVSHLVEKAFSVTPTVAGALGIPDEPLPIDLLRSAPARYRGRWMFYEGRLGELETLQRSHPLEGFDILQGYIETDDGEIISFYVSSRAKSALGGPDPRESLPTIDSFVRVEGYFLKLRDNETNPSVERGPLLVGRTLTPALRAWEPVEELDPAVLALIDDGEFDGKDMVRIADEERGLLESQDIPLWHLASYARKRRADGESFEEWRQRPAFVTEDQLNAYLQGEAHRTRRGEPIRLLGTYVQAKYSPAAPNPIGAEHWTEVWMQIRDLGAKLVPVWVPKKIDEFKYNQGLEVKAYYFRNMRYPVRRKETNRFGREQRVVRDRMTPVFVAADLDRYVEGPEHPDEALIRYIGLTIVLVLVMTFLVVGRRDAASSRAHQKAMLARRRKGRGSDGDPPAETPSDPNAPATS